MTLIVIEDLKTPKKSIETKTERFQYDLEQIRKISEISEFSILLYTQDRKHGNLGKYSFNSNFDSLGCVMVQEKKPKTSEVSEFVILPYNQNRKLGNLEKFWFYVFNYL